jgi:hypothetical protein
MAESFRARLQRQTAELSSMMHCCEVSHGEQLLGILLFRFAISLKQLVGRKYQDSFLERVVVMASELSR